MIENYLNIPNKEFFKVFRVSRSICCCLSFKFAFSLLMIINLFALLKFIFEEHFSS